MSCKHLIWNEYCKHKQEFCERNLFPRLCKDYCSEDELEDIKKIFKKGPATDTNCACYESTAENEYVSMLEKFINNCYPDENYGFFGMDAIRAEEYVDKNMRYLGYNTPMVNKAFVDTINNFKINHASCILRLDSFCNNMLMQPHKDYAKYYSNNFRFVLTLILGYLDKLNTVDIIMCHDPKIYFKSQVDHVSVTELSKALHKTEAYVKESNDSNLAEGMRMVEQWLEEVAKENISPKELTIADIEKQLGYKIKIVGEEK